MKTMFVKLTAATILCGILTSGVAMAYDDLRVPVPPKRAKGALAPATATTPAAAPTEASVNQAVQRQTQQRFAAASGNRGVLTQDQATKAGWGLVSDHFSDIDTSHKGYVTLDDVQKFLAARTPQGAGTQSQQQIQVIP